MDDTPKDPNVYAFLMQLVQQKHGDNVEADFLTVETDRLYMDFGENLVGYFEPKLDEAQKNQFDQLVEQNVDQETILGFLTNSIENLEQEILNVLDEYKDNYLSDNE